MIFAVLAAFIAAVLITPAGVASADANSNDGCGYSSSSFAESTVMRWAQVNGSGTSATISGFANDEAGLLLGVNGATANPSSPSHVSNASGGDPTTTDSSGRVFFPALYITNLTKHPLGTSKTGTTIAAGTGAGDWQNGGTPRNLTSANKPYVDDIFGSWTTATTSPNYQATKPQTQNHWNLGSGADNPNGTTFSAMGDEGYGSEVRWNAGTLTDSDGNPLSAGNSYRFQIITHDGDQNKNGGDAGEFCTTLSIPGVPAISVTKLERDGNAGSFVTGPIVANAGDTVQYEVQATNTGSTDLTLSLTDSPCDQSTIAGPTKVSGTLNGSTLSPGGVAQYTCSHKLTAADGYSFTNTASVVGQPPTGSPVSGTASVVANVPAITVVKLQRDGNTGSFTHNTISGTVGDTINYEIQATNTGNTTLDLSIVDTPCDSTPQGPTQVSGTLNGTVLSPGGVAQYTCSHKLTTADGNTGSFTNTATVTGKPPTGNPVTGTDQVTVNASPAPAPAIQVVKLQRDGSTGSFTHDVINFKPGDTIQYEIQATNTGNVPLTLSLDDSLCDSGTIGGPTVLKGTLSSSGELSPGGQAQYTCSHATTAGQTSQVVNTATVTGTPPSGTPVTGTDTVTATPTPVTNPGDQLKVIKSQRIGNNGPFTRNIITARPGSVIEYQLDVIVGGQVPIALQVNDPMCDAGTLTVLKVLKGTLTNGTLTPNTSGGEVLYTCSHVLKATDGKLVVINGKKLRQFTNVVNVTGTPKTGSPLHARSTVTLNVVRKPKPAPNPSRPAKHGTGFTG